MITHGGATVMTLLMMRQRFVAVPNPIAADQHQLHFLRRLARQIPIHWTDDLDRLPAMIEAARMQPPDFRELPSLVDDLRGYLQSSPARPGRRGTGSPIWSGRRIF